MSDERNMYGCTRCPACGGQYRYPIRKDGRDVIVCDDCFRQWPWSGEWGEDGAVTEESSPMRAPGARRTTVPDCGDNSCLYRDRTKPGGMRTNGGCRCDECPVCGKYYRRWNPGVPQHLKWCSQPEWIPEHHRKPEAA